jgi:hypothetical protein
MGLALIIVGILVMLLLSFTVGLILVIIGVFLLFVPTAPGHINWRR